MKLNELFSYVGGASKGLVSVEDFSETELPALETPYQRLVDEPFFRKLPERRRDTIYVLFSSPD